MENNIIKDNNDKNDDFFKINHRKDEDMVKKYQELYVYLKEDEYGIRHDFDKLKEGNFKNQDLLICSIFAVNFWRKKEKGKQNNDKTNEKANEIKRMVETLNYDIESYNGKSELIDYDWNFQKQIDIVNSIEKILGAFMNVDPELFDIKKFDDFMSMSKENYAEFYNVIWAARQFSKLDIIRKYEIFLSNNEVLDGEIKTGTTKCNLFKMNLALNKGDLEKIKARIAQIYKLYYYISSLDSALTENNFNSIKGKIPGGKSIIGLLECGKEELESQYLDFTKKYIESSDKKENINMNNLQLNSSLRNLYCAFHNMKKNIDDISKSISDLKNPPAKEIKNNLEEKILWNNECAPEKRKDFFEIANTVDEMREKYKERRDFAKENSIFADLQTPIEDVVTRFRDFNLDLQLTDEKGVTVESKLRKKYKDVHIATFAINHFHKDGPKIDDNQKICESIAMMHTLDIDKGAPVNDLNKAACIIEKIFLAFMDVDIQGSDIKKFDAFVGMDSEKYMKFIEIATAADHAYKFIEKYQELINFNENIDKNIEELTDKFYSGDPITKTFCPEEKDLKDVINGYEASKIKLALSKSDFEKVKKRIDKFSWFAKWSYVLQMMFNDNIIGSYYGYLEKTDNNAVEYLNYEGDQQKQGLNNFLQSLLTKNFDELKSLYSNKEDQSLQALFYHLTYLKKNIFNVLLDPKKSQIKEETINKLKNKIKKLGADNLNELIKDSYEKIEEEIFSQWDYTTCENKFINQGKEEAKKEINNKTKMIAREYMEDKKERIEKSIELYKDDPETYQKFQANLERINKFNELKNNTGESFVPTIFVEDKYFGAETYKNPTDENLYTSEPMSNFDKKKNLLTRQGRNTCYFMSIFIGLIEKGMGSYIKECIIRDYKPDKNGKTKKAVVRLFDENGCPVDFVVDKSKSSQYDDRPLWICVLEKATSVMMNRTNFQTRANKNDGRNNIAQNVDWMELAKKQENQANIFDENAFSTDDIANATESIGIQMILGKTFFKKCTGQPGRKIQYAKEGDETLGFIEEALQNNKLVLASTYRGCSQEHCNKCDKGIPHGDFIRFDTNFTFPKYHVGYIKSINCKNNKITLIDSKCGMTEITFSQFKKYFSDIHVTDFPQEAERLKQKEQSEKLPKEVEKNIKILNDAKDSIQNFEKTRVKIKKDIENGIQNLTSQIENNKKELETQTKNSINSIQSEINKFTNLINDLKTDVENNSGILSNLNDSLNQIKNDIQIIQTNAEQFDTQIKIQINQILDQQNQIKDNYSKTVNDVQQQNKEINENINSISDDLQTMSNNIQQKDYDQLLDAKTAFGEIKRNINDLKKSKMKLAGDIESNITKLNDDKERLNADYAKIIDSLNQQKTDLQNSINQKISNLNQLTGENSNFKKLEDFIATKQNAKYELAQQAEQIKKDIDKIKTENQTLKETTDKNLKDINTELDNVEKQKESYCEQIKGWEKIPYTLESAKKNLEQLKNNPDIPQDLKAKIDNNLSGLDNIKNDFDSQIKEQINNELETRNQQMKNLIQIEPQMNWLELPLKNFEESMKANTETLNNEKNKLNEIDNQIQTLANNKKDFEQQIAQQTKTLNDEQNKLNTIDKQIETLENNKKDFEQQIAQQTKTLNDEQNKLNTIDKQINTLENNKKDFEQQINQQIEKLNNDKTDFENQINPNQYTKALNKEKENLETIDQQIEQLETNYKQLENEIPQRNNEIQQKIAGKYDLTLNKIKKWGIGVSVIGGVGTISVGLIPGVNIVFIAVPSPFALLGIILLGIYFYRNSKRPPQEAIIITVPVDNDSKKSINKTMKKVVEQQKKLDDQTEEISGNENIITTKSDIYHEN